LIGAPHWLQPPWQAAVWVGDGWPEMSGSMLHQTLSEGNEGAVACTDEHLTACIDSHPARGDHIPLVVSAVK